MAIPEGNNFVGVHRNVRVPELQKYKFKVSWIVVFIPIFQVLTKGFL